MTIRFELVDRYSEPSRMCNEDAFGTSEVAAWVIDGTKGPFDHTLTPGPSDAAWHAEALNIALLTQFAGVRIHPPQALTEAAAQLSRAYATNARVAAPHEQPSACLALVALDAAGMLHLFNIGDCRILIERAGTVSGFGSSAIERLENAAIAELTRLRAQQASASDPWIALRATFRHNFETAMNKPDGYWVVHPSLPWRHEVQSTILPAREVDHVLIASDGFYRLVNVFGAYDDLGLVAAASGKGLAALYAELRVREAADVSCRLHPRLNASDDATAVLVRVRC